MKIVKLKDLSSKDLDTVIKRSAGTYENIISQVKTIIDDVKKQGNKAIIEKYQKRIGKQYTSIRVTAADFQSAYTKVDKKVVTALKHDIKNIRAVHEAQLPKKIDKLVTPEIGISVWREWRAIEKVGVYIPGGKAIYPSSVLMSVIPAQIAGCKEIVLTTPPDNEGNIPAATLVAADLLRVKNVYKVGGAQAIAALTYGTESIPKVYKIFGAGNSFVTTAKMQVYGIVDIDMPAGPSEVMIIADETAKPSFIAADLLADGEHAEDSACVLVTTSERIAKQAQVEIEKQLKMISTEKRARASLERYGRIIVVNSLSEAIAFANEYAAEHLQIMTKNPVAVAKKINNAGSIFLGDWTCKASGDYATGANHVLPTGGMAKMFPPLGVDAYGKWMQVQECTQTGLIAIRQTLETLAEVELLPAHKNSTSIRFRQ